MHQYWIAYHGGIKSVNARKGSDEDGRNWSKSGVCGSMTWYIGRMRRGQQVQVCLLKRLQKDPMSWKFEKLAQSVANEWGQCLEIPPPRDTSRQMTILNPLRNISGTCRTCTCRNSSCQGCQVGCRAIPPAA